jgi:hypothetical protein
LFPRPETYSKSISLLSSPDIGTNEESHNIACSESKTLLWIKIQSSNVQNSNSFCVPVSLMLQREAEMQAAARENKIGKERWTSSRIFRMWKSHCAKRQRKQQSKLEHGSQKRKINNSDDLGEIILQMTPEVSLQNSNSSCSFFRWKPWLTTCIRSYYNTGNLRIPNECTGDDILLTLEYFGILTASPDDFVFDSSHAYVRIQAWSRYFTQRADVAESLLESYDDAEMEEGDQKKRRLKLKLRSHLRTTLIWVLFKEKEIVVKDQYKYHVMEDSTSDPKAESETSLDSNSTAIRRLTVKEALYNLFLGRKEKKRAINREYTLGEEYEGGIEANMLSKEMPSRMRHDFCQHLRKSLPPWSSVRFDIERLEVTPLSLTKREKSTMPTIEYRPVMRIYDSQLHTARTTLKKEENYSITDHLKSVEEFAVMTSNQPLCDQYIPPCRSIGKVSSLVHSDKNDTSFNGQKRNNIEKYRNSFNTVDALSEFESNQTETFDESQQTHKPITYVNMELGDLRSVTSVLSEPIIDDRRGLNGIHTSRKVTKHRTDKKWCQRGSPALVKAKQIVQKRSGRGNQKSNFKEVKTSELPPPSFNPSKPPRYNFDQSIGTPPRTTSNLRTTPPWDGDRTSNKVEDNKDFRNSKNNNKNIVGKGNDASTSEALVKESKAITESDVSEWDDENSDTKSKTGATASYGSWGQFLASVCEVIIPAPSSSILSSSPIRHFTISSSKSTSSTAASSDDEHETCLGEDSSEMVSTPNGFIDQAKKVGNDLSYQFDELMKLAYNEKDQEGVHPIGHQSLSPILEEIPHMLSIDTDEDRTLTSCLTSSIVGLPRKTRTCEKFEKFRNKNSNYLPDKMISNMTYATPKSKPFQLDSFNNSNVPFPLRLDERSGPRFARYKQAVARKKENYSDFPMRNVLSDNASKGNRGFKLTGKSRGLSVSATTSSVTANDYNKENRYSRHENRFYS